MRDYNMMRDMLVFASVAEYVETDIGSHRKPYQEVLETISTSREERAMGLFGNKETREEKQARKAAKKQAEKRKLEKYGKVLQFMFSDDMKCTLFLRENGIEFTTQNNEDESGIALWSEINSISLEDGEELQSRVTATRLLMLGVFAFAAKKKTGGNKFITVEGEDFLWALEVGRKKVSNAQRLVLKARQLMKKA